MTSHLPALPWLLPTTGALAAVGAWAAGSRTLSAALAVVWVLLAGALLRLRVVADAEGATVVNVFRSVYLPWGEVAAVAMDPTRDLAVFSMRSGEMLSAWALFAVLPGRGAARVRRTVAELEQVRRDHRGPRAQYPDSDWVLRTLHSRSARTPWGARLVLGTVLGGLLGLGVGAGELAEQLGYSSDGVRTDARVTARSPWLRDGSLTVTYPVDGTLVTGTLDWGSEPPAIGTTIPVVYRSTDPTDVIAAGTAGTRGYVAAAATLLFGVVATGYAAWQGVRRARWRTSTSSLLGDAPPRRGTSRVVRRDVGVPMTLWIGTVDALDAAPGRLDPLPTDQVLALLAAHGYGHGLTEAALAARADADGCVDLAHDDGLGDVELQLADGAIRSLRVQPRAYTRTGWKRLMADLHTLAAHIGAQLVPDDRLG